MTLAYVIAFDTLGNDVIPTAIIAVAINFFIWVDLFGLIYWAKAPGELADITFACFTCFTCLGGLLSSPILRLW